MLIIGDIHITTKWSSKILHCLRSFVANNPSDDHILFLGDFVYHFSYDRKALLQLFQFFIELFTQGKHVYVVAGNHDRVGGHFVFEEARQAFDLLQTVSGDGFGTLKFITTPMFLTLQTRDYLFFPFYHLPLDTPIEQEFQELGASTHQGEQHSARANSCLQRYINERRARETRSEELVLVHHRYIAQTVFPWQQAVFSYKNPALSASLLEESDIKMLSWHIHKPFCLKNYLCTGSVRSTSSLEYNQVKYLYRLTPEGHVEAYPAQINPYVRFPIVETDRLDEQMIRDQEAVIAQQQKHVLQQGTRTVTVHEATPQKLGDISLLLESPTVQYSMLSTVVSDEILQQVADIKLKKPYRALPDISEELDSASLDLTKSIADRKVLLKRYLISKYGAAAPSYEHVLESLEIL